MMVGSGADGGPTRNDGAASGTMPGNPRPFTIDTDSRGRAVQVALVVAGIPFVVSLAGLVLRSPLADLPLLDEGPLAVGAAASGAALTLIVAGAWAVDWWTVRRQMRALDAVNRELEASGRELETERARHAMESKIEPPAIEDPADGEPAADLRVRPAVLDAAAEPLKLPERTS